MRELEPAERTERGLDRLVTFCDAVVAIAITLVVLPLVDSARDLDGGTTAYLVENRDALLAAGISFAVIALFWLDHHALFELATGYTRGVLRACFLWLAGIVVLPVVTVLDVAASPQDRVALACYLGAVLVISLAARLLEVLLSRAGVLAPDPRGEPVRAGLARWVTVALLVAATVTALLVPGVGLYPLLVLTVSPALTRLVAGPRPAP